MASTTYVPRQAEVRNNWLLLDAEDKILGKVATKAAMALMGKHKPDYTPFLKTGDFVVIVNAEKVVVTGRKEEEKVYRRHSGYPGGLKEVGLKTLREKHPDRIVRSAVLRMLPKNKLGRQLATRLKIYAGSEHPHEAQNPKQVTV